MIRGDSLKAWEERMRDVCGGCGMRTLTAEFAICTLCGTRKTSDWAARNRVWPLAPKLLLEMTHVGLSYLRPANS